MKTCAVIGMGPIGNTHAKIYESLPNAKLVAVCDKIPERVDEARRNFQVRGYKNAEAMLKAEKPDICSIATGGYEYGSDHAEPTIEALRAGCHVLCEKPISNDIESAKKMVKEAQKLGRCFGIDFNHRFTPAAYAAKKWQNEERLGHLLFVNMALWIGKFEDPSSEFFHLKALNPHSVDMMRHFCGEINSVHCYATKAPGRRLWSTASIHMQFANGAVGHLTSSYDIERGHPMERCEIAGVKGRMVIEDMWRKATLYPAGDPTTIVYTNPVFGGVEGFYDTFHERLRVFVQQIEQNTSPEQIDGSGLDGLKAQIVIQAAIDSLLSGKSIPVHPSEEF